MKLPLLQYDAPKIKKFNKKRLVIGLVLLFVLIAPAGRWVIKEVFTEKVPEGNKTEAVMTGQSGEPKDADAKDADAADTAGTGDLEGRLASDFIRTLNSQNYVIRYTTTTVYKGKAYEVETTYAVSGGSIAMASADRATVVRDDRVYMMNHTDRTIISWEAGKKDDNLKRIDTKGMVYEGGRTEGGLVCEEYTAASARYKLYFKGEKLVKMTVSVNGQDVGMDIIEVDKLAPGSLFEVPPGYQVTNI